ncbi:MAG: glycosyltransferase family 2 protein, partial [Rhizonema sp. NSF051]|nr:glycosyltransferase family 2 protein [Rhizonema sp. NSF051]
HSIFSFDYNTTLMLINGFEDYMKGPEFIETTDPESLHGKVVALSKSYKSQTLKLDSSANNQHREKSSATTLKKLIGLLTLNGHLLPNFLLSKEPAYYWLGSDYADSWFKSFTKKRIIFAREGNSSIYQHEMNRVAGIGLLMKWLQVIVKNVTKWSSVNSEWRNAFDRLTSVEFWRKYLKLNEQT